MLMTIGKTTCNYCAVLGRARNKGSAALLVVHVLTIPAIARASIDGVPQVTSLIRIIRLMATRRAVGTVHSSGANEALPPNMLRASNIYMDKLSLQATCVGVMLSRLVTLRDVPTDMNTA